MIKIANKIKKIKMDADTWLRKNFEYVVDKHAGGFVIIVDNEGIVFTNKDGKPRDLILRVKAKYPKSIPLFFRVPRPRDFLCALIIR